MRGRVPPFDCEVANTSLWSLPAGLMLSYGERHIYLLAAASAAMAVAAIVVPRFVPVGEGGLAAAATAALVFFGLLIAAAAIAVAALALTIRRYAVLSGTAKVAGIVPALVLVGAVVWLVLYLRY